MSYKGLIDNHNISLWNELKNIHEIEILLYENDIYQAHSQIKKTIIYVPTKNIDSASFTHELLHIHLHTKGIFVGGRLKMMVRENQSLSKILSNDLLEHIGNCLDHIKTLPEFIKLGYNRKDFLFDYSVIKLTEEDLTKIKKLVSINEHSEKVYESSIINSYIGKYIAAKACPNNTLDYTNELMVLKSLDTELYDILESLLSAWNKFDCNDQDPITGEYNSFLSEFIEQLKSWTKGKRIK